MTCQRWNMSMSLPYSEMMASGERKRSDVKSSTQELNTSKAKKKLV